MTSRVPPPLTDIGKFYKQLDDFKEKMLNILGQLDKNDEIIEINKYYDKFNLAKKANVRYPIELLYNYGVKVYVTKILLREEEFFIGEVKNFEKKPLKINEYEINQNDLLFIKQIRSVWDHLEIPIKNNIWNYIQVICLLAEKVVGGNVIAIEKQRLLKSGLLK